MTNTYSAPSANVHTSTNPQNQYPLYGAPAPQYGGSQAKQSFLVRKPMAALVAVAIGVGALSGAVGGGVGMLIAENAGSSYGVTRDGGLATSAGQITPVAADAGTVEAAAKTIGPSVVTIAVSGTGGSGEQVAGTGSGIIIREDGYILTNNHVVAEGVGGGKVSVTFSDGKTADATIVGTDPSSDLAVIKVSGQSNLKAAVFADSAALRVGQPVLAVGAPLGLSNTVTQGIVSTLHRPVTTGEGGGSSRSVMDAIQTDAAINPGNSGGALVDLAGRVVGINSAIATVGATQGQSGNIGVGFAIPANDAKRVAAQLISTGKATHSQLGVSVGASAGGSNAGATLSQVTAGGPAAEAGLRSGDVVTKVNDRVVTDADSLIVAIRSQEPGSTVELTYQRGGKTETTKATLEAVN